VQPRVIWHAASGTLQLTNSTVTGNQATSGTGGAGGVGGTGAVNGQAGTPGNTGQASSGGGIFNSAGALTLKKTQVADNLATIDPDLAGTFLSDN
jgi:hypothetical protein